MRLPPLRGNGEWIGWREVNSARKETAKDLLEKQNGP